MKPIRPGRSTLAFVAAKKKSGGRVTPKGGHINPAHTHGTGAGPEASSRYTPRVPVYKKQSPVWMLYILFGGLGLGSLIILFYYLGFVPGGRSNWYLAAGLLSILGGLYTATKYQ